jgi:cytochrome c553
MNRFIIVVISVLGSTPMLSQAIDVDAAAQPSAAQTSAARIAVGTCAGCHGASGVSTMPKFPVLAAQRTTYLVDQLKAFKSKTRDDPDAVAFMQGIAASLNDAQIAGLAQYYSSQRAHSGAGVAVDSAAAARGREIYENGIEAQNVPGCRSCHGAKAEGKVEGPRLAGQHSQYFLSQMTSYRLNLRDAAAMHEVAVALKPSDIEDLAAYIGSR